MTAITDAFGRKIKLAAAFIFLLVAFPLSPAVAQHVVVMVNGDPITSLDIEYRARLNQLSTHKKPSRQEVIDELIGDKLKIFEAKRYKLEVTKQEVDAAYATMAKRMGATAGRLSQLLASNGSNESSLKLRISAEIVWGKLVRGRFQSSLQIPEKDILSIMGAKDSQKAAGYEYVLRPILVVVPRGSSEAVIAAKRREAENLRARFQNCEQGIPFARALRDVAVRAQITRNAADLSPQLRKVLDSVEIGRLTSPEVTANGIEMFALCGKRTNTDDTVSMRETRNKIFAERFEAKANNYLKEIRRGAMIEYREQTVR